LLQESLLFLAHARDFLIEKFLSLFNVLNHVRIARHVDRVQQGGDLAIQIKQASLLVAELDTDKHF
jgi:hypothetical protein